MGDRLTNNYSTPSVLPDQGPDYTLKFGDICYDPLNATASLYFGKESGHYPKASGKSGKGLK